MFTAIVLDKKSSDVIVNRARGLRLIGADWALKAHHITLAMGDKRAKFKVGERRIVTVTHYGVTEGRLCAFRVKRADDSENATPHVTAAIAPGAKPVESNAIAEWIECEPFPLYGKVEICD